MKGVRILLKQVCVVQHNPIETLGVAESVLKENGFTHQCIRVFAGDKVPTSINDICGVIILGGPMGVNEADRFQFLNVEMNLIRAALKEDIPIFGVCLGSQLLASVLGGRVYRSDYSEFGWFPLFWEDACTNDPVFDGLHGQSMVYLWHNDIFDLPTGAVSLARTEATNCQAFRYGKNAYGLLFHLEAMEDEIEQMAVQMEAI